MQQGPGTKEQWELVAVVLAVLAGVFAVVRWPVWWSFKHLVREALKTELDQLTTVARIANANEDRLEAIQAAIEAHGVALREVPRMSGAVEAMTSTLEGLRETIGDLNKLVVGQGHEIGRVTGFIDSQGWRGEERRRKGRRSEDPPQDEDPT